MKKVFRLSIIMGMMLATASMGFAQGAKTADELKAEREQLKAELKSENVQKRQEKLAKLQNPGTVGVASVDELAVSSALLLAGTEGFNKTVPELYKRTIGETIDGVTDVTVQKPSLEELTDLAASIAVSIAGVAIAQDAVQKAGDDVKNMPKLQAPKAAKSLNYSKDVLSLTLPELQLSAKVVANLIETIKTSDNY